MKTFKGFLYGIAVAIAVSATAATVYNYFPPPGMTYSPTAGLVMGTATGGSKGAGTINAQGIFVNGSAPVSGAAGSTGNVQINNAGAFFANSDFNWDDTNLVLTLGNAGIGGPIITTQATSTSFGNQVFIQGGAAAANGTGGGVVVDGGGAVNNTGGTTTVRGGAGTGTHAGGSGLLQGGQAANATGGGVGLNTFAGSTSGNSSGQIAAATGGASGSGNSGLIQLSTGTVSAGTAGNISLITGFANGGGTSGSIAITASHNAGGTDGNVTISAHGAVVETIGAGLQIGAPTGGDQGAGSINMQSCFVNGVACSTGGASGANPTGTVGLTAVNGSAGTFLRSDGAPALSQAIAPTWTGNHTFTPSSGTPVTINTASGQSALNINGSSGRALMQFQLAGTRKGFITSVDTANSFCNGAVTGDLCLSSSANSIDFSGNDGASISTIINSSGTQTSFLGVGRAPSSGVTKIVTDNGGSGDTEIVSQTTTAGNAQFRAVTIGGTNWSFGNLRSDLSFDICNASTISTGCPLAVLSSTPSIFSGATSSTFATAGRRLISLSGSTDSMYELQVAGTATGYFYAAATEVRLQSAPSVPLNFYPGNANKWTMASSGGMFAAGQTDQGSGSINAANLYQTNSWPVARFAAWAGTCSSGGCVTGKAIGVSSVTRSSTGNYTVTFSTAFSNGVCTASPYSSISTAVGVYVNIANSTTTVTTVNGSAAAVDQGFAIQCVQ